MRRNRDVDSERREYGRDGRALSEPFDEQEEQARLLSFLEIPMIFHSWSRFGFFILSLSAAPFHHPFLHTASHRDCIGRGFLCILHEADGQPASQPVTIFIRHDA